MSERAPWSYAYLKAIGKPDDRHGINGREWSRPVEFKTWAKVVNSIKSLSENFIMPEAWTDGVEPYDPAKDPIPPWIERDSPEYRDLRVELIEAFAPGCHQCRTCGGPVLSGYRCDRCGERDP